MHLALVLLVHENIEKSSQRPASLSGTMRVSLPIPTYVPGWSLSILPALGEGPQILVLASTEMSLVLPSHSTPCAGVPWSTVGLISFGGSSRLSMVPATALGPGAHTLCPLHLGPRALWPSRGFTCPKLCPAPAGAKTLPVPLRSDPCCMGLCPKFCS